MPRKRYEPTHGPYASQDKRVSDEAADMQSLPWLSSAVTVLFTSRFFLPAESADQGETLWIVLLWLLCGVVWLAAEARRGNSLRRPDWLDVGLLLLVGGHVASSLAVLMTEGHKRAALNMLWEWVGIGVAGLLLRSVLRDREGRERLLSCVLISGVVLSGLGLWQHFVWYPQISGQFSELERLETAAQASPPSLGEAESMRLRELRSELGGAPVSDVSSLRMLRDRIQSSTEPIGRFALANTFAGLLLVALIIALGSRSAWKHARNDPWSVAIGVTFICWLGYCLLLTKSRTAMIGLIAGLVVEACFAGRSLLASRRAVWTALSVMTAVAVMVVAAVLSGSLDQQVISESSKSLRYRLEYWSATVEVIREHPLLGGGPGNFRQQYLRHKLPASSEEILDPHNFVLDVLANGGVMAFAGMMCLLGISIVRGMSLFRRTSAEPNDGAADSVVNRVLLLGSIGSLAIVIAAIVEVLHGTALRSDWILLAGGWWLTAILVALSRNTAVTGTLLVSALVGLLVHLTGAGGIAMPAILQLVLALILAVDAIALPVPDSPNRSIEARTQPVMLGCLVIGLAAVVLCAVTATIPVTKSQAAMNLGRAAWSIDGNPSVAMRAYLLATEDDDLDPEPWQELAGVRMARWTHQPTESAFASAVEAQEESIARDPVNPSRWRALGELWWQRYEHSREPEHAAAALSAFQEAVSRYPHLASLMADVARSAAAAGEAAIAAQAAQHALTLDDLNTGFQHTDKILSHEIQTEMRRLIDKPDSHNSE